MASGWPHLFSFAYVSGVASDGRQFSKEYGCSVISDGSIRSVTDRNNRELPAFFLFKNNSVTVITSVNNYYDALSKFNNAPDPRAIPIGALSLFAHNTSLGPVTAKHELAKYKSVDGGPILNLFTIEGFSFAPYLVYMRLNTGI